MSKYQQYREMMWSFIFEYINKTNPLEMSAMLETSMKECGLWKEVDEE